MNQHSKSERTTLLSAYLDHELDDAGNRDVEELLAADPEARAELAELKNLRQLLSAGRRLPPAIGFATRLSAELDRRKREEENLLPFPRKYVPAVATIAAMLIVAVSIVLYQSRERVVDYVSEQSGRVQRAVSENVLKGSILPLFANLDKNQVLQFAMFGTIPLDAKAETELKVDEDSSKWCTINVNKAGASKTKPVTVKEFVDEVRPTRVQLQIIDSLLDLGRQKLEGSIFVAEDKAMAVHPELSHLNKVMLSGIAAALEPDQRTRFDRFLKVRRAPYALASVKRSAASMDRILTTLKRPERTDRFVVVTPETVVVAGLHFDLDSVRLHFRRVAEQHRDVAVQVNGLFKRIAGREGGVSQHYSIPAPPVRVFGDSEVFTIQIGTNWEGLRLTEPDMWVRPRMPIRVGVPRKAPPAGFSFNFNFDEADSAFFFNLDVDSLMMRFSKDVGGAGLQIFRNDPRLRDRFFEAERAQTKHITDSAVLAKKRKQWSKLDSLMREMEKRELRNQFQPREHRQRDDQQ